MDQFILDVCFAVWLVIMLMVTQETHAYTCFLNSEPDHMNSVTYRWSIHERDLCGCTSLRLGTKYKSLQCTKNRRDLQQWMQCDQEIKRWAPFEDCRDLYNIGVRTNGEYTIFPPKFSRGIGVYCDMDEGGWTVIQRRKDGTVDFNRTWNEYSAGFGSLTGEFWWGNSKLLNFTFPSQFLPYWELNVTVGRPNGNSGTAMYNLFFLSGEMFKLSAGFREVSGSGERIGDALGGLDLNSFSTYNRDNDNEAGTHCASVFGGGWWYKSCPSVSMRTNLNGVYGTPPTGGIIWDTWPHESLSFTEMKIRRFLG